MSCPPPWTTFFLNPITMITLTEIQTRILEALAHYRYLTHSQMLRLGIGSASFLRFSTRRLREKGSDEPLIESVAYPFTPREGRLEQVHHLTPAGAAVLADVTNKDTYRKLRPVTAVYHRDYWHRKYTIDFQIALTQALAGDERLDLLTFDRYFDKTGANRGRKAEHPLRSKTRVDIDADHHLIPDANIVLSRPFNPKHRALYTAEIVNGQDTKRILRQIERHAEVLQKQVLAAKYDLPAKTTHQVLFIFSDYGLLRSVRTRLVEVKAALPFSACYRFGFLQYLTADPIRCWKLPKHVSDDWYHLITGKPVTDTEAQADASTS